MFALAFARCVPLEPKQELDRRRSARPPGCPTAVRRVITGQCPLTRDTWRIIRTRRGSLPLPRPRRKRPGCKALPHGTAGHRPLGRAAPSRAQAGASGDATSLLLQPSWAWKGKKFGAWLCKLFPSQRQSGAVFLLWGPHEGPPPDPPKFAQLTTLHAGASVLPACQEPQKTCGGGGGGGSGPSGPATSSSSAAPGRRELKSARERQRGGVGLRGGGGTGLKLLFLANGDLFFLLPGG